MKFLTIDLTRKAWSIQEADKEMLRHYLGGRGLGIRLLYDRLSPGTEALEPGNPLIFTTGLFTGTEWPSAAQWSVTAKSPLTKALGGGFAWGRFGILLRRLGYAAVVIEGKSDHPVSLIINQDGPSFSNAETLWGLDTQTVTRHFELTEPGCSVACIGPAGETLSGLAGIFGDRYQMIIRTGLGAVMGSKLLKAVVVMGGGSEYEINASFLSVSRGMRDQVESHPASVRLREQGKPMLIRGKNQVGDLPTRNHQETGFDEFIDQIDGNAVRRVTVSARSCEGCPIGCMRVTRTERVTTEGPEYEPIWALGPRIGNGDLTFLIELYDACLRQGLDPIGFGGVTAFAMECVQRGAIQTTAPLRWGNREDTFRLLNELVQSKGLGGELRNGSRAYYAVHPETRPWAMESKGVELSGQEPRQSKAFALSLAVSNWGADWGYGLPTIDVAQNEGAARRLFPDCWEKILNVTAEEKKAALVKFTEEYNALSDSLGICKFACPETYALMPEDLAKGYSTYTGKNMDEAQLLTAGERIINLERLFNLREGLTSAADTLPSRFLTEPITVDICEGNRLTGLRRTGRKRTLVCDLEVMRSEYYRLRGWPDGTPSSEKLQELELGGFSE